MIEKIVCDFLFSENSFCSMEVKMQKKMKEKECFFYFYFRFKLFSYYNILHIISAYFFMEMFGSRFVRKKKDKILLKDLGYLLRRVESVLPTRVGRDDIRLAVLTVHRSIR